MTPADRIAQIRERLADGLKIREMVITGRNGIPASSGYPMASDDVAFLLAHITKLEAVVRLSRRFLDDEGSVEQLDEALRALDGEI